MTTPQSAAQPTGPGEDARETSDSRSSIGAASLPVYVDLDGTLISTDILWESLCALAGRAPVELLKLPGILLHGGRAALKVRVSEKVALNTASLPYRREVLDYLEQARAAGRRRILASASERSLVEAVAEHLGIFDAVLASDPATNLRGVRKLQAIRRHSREVLGGNGEFEYLGDSGPDLPILLAATQATMVAPSPRLEARVRGAQPSCRTLVARRGWLRPALEGLRVFQWAKNGLLFVPLLLAHQLADPSRWRNVLLSFAAFCGVASATYLINDLLDIEADRQHREKARRPFASGRLPIPVGLALAIGLLITSFSAALALLPMACTGMLVTYAILTLCYSLYFKAQILLDVFVLAGLYTLRVLTGGVAGNVPISPWLLAFSGFFFLSLALAKRYVELSRAQLAEREGLSRRGYRLGDIDGVATMGVVSGYIAILVLALFVSSDDVSRLYRTPVLLWMMCPVMLYWISRVWMLARRDELDDDPVLFALRDRTSYLCGALIAIVVIGAAI